MLAGRKLLLADDSITIQKVVDLTFADEGVSVVCVSNGREAIERLEEFAPDVVLADVFMPQMSGYEVCEYIKQNEKLKHIPVMLLVGSFEPFDEAEARRVGADDTLTKPFQSIRRLIDKVGLLVSGRPAEEETPTAQLPRPEPPEPEKLSEAEIAITTADTQPLPPELRGVVEEAAMRATTRAGMEAATDTKVDEARMESKVTAGRNEVSETYRGGDVLLDLGDYAPGPASAEEDFVLDIDLDEVPEASPIESSFPVSAYVRQNMSESVARDWKHTAFESRERRSSVINPYQPNVVVAAPTATADLLATTEEFPKRIIEAAQEPEKGPAFLDARVVSEQAQQLGAKAIESHANDSLQQLTPEMIDVIARRAVEHLSEKVVQEIVWEVVPQLAELMIKRQLDEKNS